MLMGLHLGLFPTPDTHFSLSFLGLSTFNLDIFYRIAKGEKEPLPPLPKLLRAKPIGTSKDVIPSVASVQTITIPDKTKKVTEKEPSIKASKKKAQTKTPVILDPIPNKKVDSSTEELLLTLMEEIKGLKIFLRTLASLWALEDCLELMSLRMKERDVYVYRSERAFTRRSAGASSIVWLLEHDPSKMHQLIEEKEYESIKAVSVVVKRSGVMDISSTWLPLLGRLLRSQSPSFLKSIVVSITITLMSVSTSIAHEAADCDKKTTSNNQKLKECIDAAIPMNLLKSRVPQKKLLCFKWLEAGLRRWER
ncbi:hypothetical protein Tco_0327346 [Tanacetum coccineum]